MDMKGFGKLNKALNVNQAAGNELMFYPHLDGDKTIYADPELRGAFTGISLSTTQEDMFYAVVEGPSAKLLRFCNCCWAGRHA